jgi:hypothetical protein
MGVGREIWPLDQWLWSRSRLGLYPDVAIVRGSLACLWIITKPSHVSGTKTTIGGGFSASQTTEAEL